MTTKLERVRAEFSALYVRDVQQYPATYKEAVRNNPAHAAEVLMCGLAAHDVGRLLSDLKAERRRLGA